MNWGIGLASALLVVGALATGSVSATCMDVRASKEAAHVDEIAISNLMAEYSARLEARDWEGFGCLFSHGALLDSEGHVQARGAAAVTALLEKTLGKQPADLLVRRIFTNPKIMVDRSHGTASAQSYLTTIYVEPGKAPRVYRLATYIDSFGKIGGQWWFLARQESTKWVAK